MTYTRVAAHGHTHMHTHAHAHASQAQFKVAEAGFVSILPLHGGTQLDMLVSW